MRTTFYLGGGSANTDDAFENDDTPFSVGLMHRVKDSRWLFGFDIAREGTLMDSTWGRNDEAEQGMSFNLLVGGNMIDNGRFRSDAALLVGVRESSADCPDSYLGFRCYADTEPDSDYKANLGGVVTVSYNSLTLGLRATGESAQLIAGIRF